MKLGDSDTRKTLFAVSFLVILFLLLLLRGGWGFDQGWVGLLKDKVDLYWLTVAIALTVTGILTVFRVMAPQKKSPRSARGLALGGGLILFLGASAEVIHNFREGRSILPQRECAEDAQGQRKTMHRSTGVSAEDLAFCGSDPDCLRGLERGGDSVCPEGSVNALDQLSLPVSRMDHELEHLQVESHCLSWSGRFQRMVSRTVDFGSDFWASLHFFPLKERLELQRERLSRIGMVRFLTDLFSLSSDAFTQSEWVYVLPDEEPQNPDLQGRLLEALRKTHEQEGVFSFPFKDFGDEIKVGHSRVLRGRFESLCGFNQEWLQDPVIRAAQSDSELRKVQWEFWSKDGLMRLAGTRAQRVHQAHQEHRDLTAKEHRQLLEWEGKYLREPWQHLRVICLGGEPSETRVRNGTLTLERVTFPISLCRASEQDGSDSRKLKLGCIGELMLGSLTQQERRGFCFRDRGVPGCETMGGTVSLQDQDVLASLEKKKNSVAGARGPQITDFFPYAAIGGALVSDPEQAERALFFNEIDEEIRVWRGVFQKVVAQQRESKTLPYLCRSKSDGISESKNEQSGVPESQVVTAEPQIGSRLWVSGSPSERLKTDHELASWIAETVDVLSRSSCTLVRETRRRWRDAASDLCRKQVTRLDFAEIMDCAERSRVPLDCPAGLPLRECAILNDFFNLEHLLQWQRGAVTPVAGRKVSSVSDPAGAIRARWSALARGGLSEEDSRLLQRVQKQAQRNSRFWEYLVRPELSPIEAAARILDRCTNEESRKRDGVLDCVYRLLIAEKVEIENNPRCFFECERHEVPGAWFEEEEDANQCYLREVFSG